MIETIHGPMPEDMLVKEEGVIDNDVERTQWTEYRLNGELVHRSAHVTLKQMPVFASGEAAEVG